MSRLKYPSALASVGQANNQPSINRRLHLAMNVAVKVKMADLATAREFGGDLRIAEKTCTISGSKNACWGGRAYGYIYVTWYGSASDHLAMNVAVKVKMADLATAREFGGVNRRQSR